MWSNFHSHSNYCDGKGELSEYLAAALANKLISIGFSSHAPVPFPCKWCMKKEDLPSYLEDIDHLRFHHHGIEIYKSLEIDFIPGVVSPVQFRDVLDYTIGSIHFVDKLPDGTPWEIDNTQAVFEQGLDKIFKNNFKDAVCRYYELTREMIYGSAPDIVGHLDKIKMQDPEGKYFSETDSWYRDEVEKTLKLIDAANLIIEVNTRGIYKKKTKETYPSTWILEKIKARNIPITLSSDAHLANDLINQFPETAALLYKLGFRELTVMLDGKWSQLPFNQHGIIR
jgi:histidinol-phosphatase (PHP family)